MVELNKKLKDQSDEEEMNVYNFHLNQSNIFF